MMNPRHPGRSGSRAFRRVPPVMMLASFALSAALLPGSPGTAWAGRLPGANCVMRPPPPGLFGPDSTGLAGRRTGPPVPVLPALEPRFAPAIDRAPAGMFVPVILMDFTTRPATMTPAQVAARQFGLGDTPSVRSYYREVSSDQFELTGETYEWVHSARSRDYYTFNQSGFATDASALADPYDRNVWGAIREALDLADPSVDFSRFDSDGDGVVDAAIFVLAGMGAEAAPFGTSPQHFWSHKFDLRQCLATGGGGAYCPATPGVGLVTDDGVAIGPYLVVPDIGEVGVWCHEFGHILGLPDIYFGAGPTDPMGVFDLMDYGAWLAEPTAGTPVPGSLPCHMSAWCKYTLGWIDEGTGDAAAPQAAFDVTLPPASDAPPDGPVAVRLLANPGGADWTEDGEGSGRYFLVENRQDSGFDRSLFFLSKLHSRADIGGLLVTFVDESRRTDAFDNRDAMHPLICVVQANGDPQDPDGTLPSFGDSLDFWPRRGLVPDEFSASTSPAHGIYDPELAASLLGGIEPAAGGGYAMTVNTPGSAVLYAGGSGGGPRAPASFAYPNPASVVDGSVVRIHFSPVSGVVTSLRARIMSISGQLVRTLSGDDEIDYAGSQAVWNLRDEAGREVASGLYFYVIEAGGEKAAGKIALTR